MTKMTIVLLAGLAMALPACAPTGTTYSVGTGYSSAAEMAYLGNDIWVVEDYRYPVFFNRGYYWRYDDGSWYRARYLGRGWDRVRYRRVPSYLRRIDQPYRYRYYRAPYGTRVRRGTQGKPYVRPYPRGRYYDRRDYDRRRYDRRDYDRRRYDRRDYDRRDYDRRYYR